MTSNAVLSCVDLNKAYKVGPESVSVIQDLQLQLNEGDWISIVGASGSGKTTLLNMLGGLDDPSTGQVLWGEQDIFKLSRKQLDSVRNQYLGFVYQFHHLLAEFTALENVAMPLLIGNVKQAQAYQSAKHILDKVGLHHRYDHKPAELSGGERQRVALARALVTNPKLVLLDEPTGNLDEHTALDVQNLIAELNRDLGTAFVVVTHDLSFAAKASQQYVLMNGQLQAQ